MQGAELWDGNRSEQGTFHVFPFSPSLLDGVGTSHSLIGFFSTHLKSTDCVLGTSDTKEDDSCSVCIFIMGYMSSARAQR